MKRTLFFLAIFVLARPSFPTAPQVSVNIQWEYKNFPGPVVIYEVKGKPRLWDTKSVASMSAAPIGEPIPGAKFLVTPGKNKRFALVFQNNSDSAKYFFAAPHTVHPAEHALGFKFKCLCINHAFKVGPKETWYRIVEFRLSKDFVGQEMLVTHTIIGIDQNRAAPFTKDPVQPDL